MCSSDLLSDIGLTLKSDGTLDTSAGRLDNALGNLGELRKLLTADGETSGESGFVRRFKRLADAVLSSDGSLATRTAGLRRTLDRNSKSQEAMENRLALTESRLRAQYQALDSQMAKLNSLSSYVSQQVATLASSS